MPFPYLRDLFAGFSHNHSRPRRRRASQLTLETLEDRLTPAAGLREQYMLELVNRVRQNPAAELPLILGANDANVNGALAFFNVDQNLLASQWAALVPAPPLAWNDAIAAAALGHSQAMLAAGIQSHQLPGEPDFAQRMVNAGYNWSAAAENIFAYAHSVFEAEAAFLIDWGSGPGGMQSPAGHRQNLMSSGYREIGIGMVDAPAGAATGPLLITQDFGNRFNFGNPFLLGVVYDDTNHDNFYSQGEGLGAVTLTITGNAGTFQTTTTAAGGYQIKVPAGSYQVTASGGSLPAPVTHTVVVGSVNVKDDFLRPQVVAPTLNGPAAATNNTTPTFSWNATPSAATYALWVNNVTPGQSPAQVINLQNLTTTSYTPVSRLAAGNYQAWVMAVTATGQTSAWSATYSFTINPPAIPTLTAPIGATGNTTPTFIWTASASATQYDLWVNNVTTGQSQVIRQQNLTATSFTPATALPLGTYTAWVEAFNSSNETAGWSAGFSFNIAAPAPPTLTGPAAVITSTTPTFAWNASAGAASYDVWADNLTTGQGQVVRQTVTTTSLTPANPLPRGNYAFWVRAANSSDQFGAWSAAYYFLIDSTAPAIPTVNGPGSSSNQRPNITWTASAGAALYDLWVDSLTTGQSQVIRQQTLAANSFTPAAALAVGSYRAWVRAFDSTNPTRGWSAAFDFTITLPATPGLIGPTGSSANTTPTFSWNAVADAARYDLWVDNVTTGQSQVIRQQNLTTTSFTAAALARASYRFWVRASNASGDAGNWSAALNFTIV